MTAYESEIKTLNTSAENAFETLSDLSRLEHLKNQPNIPPEIQNASFGKDEVSFSIAGLTAGAGLKIIEREPYKTIKLEGVNVPVKINAWIQLAEVSDAETKMKLTLKADLPAMLKFMLDGKIRESVNRLAETLCLMF